MSEMKLVVVGAGGRMGQAIMRAIAATEGVRIMGALGRKGSHAIGRDAGEVAGLGPIGVPVTDDPLPLFAKADGVIDFSVPQASVDCPLSTRSRSGRDRAVICSALVSMPPMIVAASPGNALTARKTSVNTTHRVTTKLMACPSR